MAKTGRDDKDDATRSLRHKKKSKFGEDGKRVPPPDAATAEMPTSIYSTGNTKSGRKKNDGG